MNEIERRYLEGFHHDDGKFAQKEVGRVAPHQVLSALLLMESSALCDDQSINTILNHHDLPDSFGSGYELYPGKTVTPEMVSKLRKIADLPKDQDAIKILRTADCLSASSDRWSETRGKNGASAAFAPLISVLGQAFDKRIAIRHGQNYETYEWNGMDDGEEAVGKNDPNYKRSIHKANQAYREEISKVSSLEDIDEIEKEFFTTVNANTWRPYGESIGNTTTSLYDHSRTTAAIAACLQVNKDHGEKIPSESAETANIDIIHLTYHGNAYLAGDILTDVLEKYNLLDLNIICQTEEEAYAFLPRTITLGFLSYLKDWNKKIWKECGDCLDYEIAYNWQFRHCDKSFYDCFTKRFYGALNISEIPGDGTQEKEYLTKTCSGKWICGFGINHYESILDKTMTGTGSVSKFATLLRIFSDFSVEVEDYLASNKCQVLLQTFSECLYVVPEEKIHDVEREIWNIWKKYSCEVTGLTFASYEFNRYQDCMSIVAEKIENKKNTLIFGKNGDATTIPIGSKRFRIQGLDKYYMVLKEAKDIPNAVLYKLIKIYEDGTAYLKDHDPIHFKAVSMINYVSQKSNDENVIQFCKKRKTDLFSEANKEITTVSEIVLEALKKAARSKNAS